jgi:predicted aminopeptidase
MEVEPKSLLQIGWSLSSTMKFARRKCTFVLSLLLLNGCALDTVPYLFQLASNQASLLSQRKPIEEALKEEDSGLTPEFRERLKSIPEIRAFASRIGLSPGGAYTQYAPVDLKVYVVTAAERTRLKRHEWWWPIVGSVPYKGFFSKEDAQQEIKKFQGR